MLEIQEISNESFGSIGGRGRWNTEGILNMAKRLSEKHAGKTIAMPLMNTKVDGTQVDGFYEQFYNGTGRIKYIGYYCKSRLTEAFKMLNIEASVKAAESKNRLLIQFMQSSPVSSDTEEVDDEADEDENEADEE